MAPGEIEPSLFDWLTDNTIEIPEAQLMGVLDDFPHDETVHAAIIARPYLTEAVVVRLIALVSQALFESLISGPNAALTSCPLLAKSGHERTSRITFKRASFPMRGKVCNPQFIFELCF